MQTYNGSTSSNAKLQCRSLELWTLTLLRYEPDFHLMINSWRLLGVYLHIRRSEFTSGIAWCTQRYRVVFVFALRFTMETCYIGHTIKVNCCSLPLKHDKKSDSYFLSIYLWQLCGADYKGNCSFGPIGVFAHFSGQNTIIRALRPKILKACWFSLKHAFLTLQR